MKTLLIKRHYWKKKRQVTAWKKIFTTQPKGQRLMALIRFKDLYQINEERTDISRERDDSQKVKYKGPVI